jgi:hypothetical protein
LSADGQHREFWLAFRHVGGLQPRVVNALTKNGNGAEKPSSQSARNVAQRSPLRRTLLFAGVFALMAMVFVPTPMDHGRGGGYRFIFDQTDTGVAFFQLLVNVAFAAGLGAITAQLSKRILYVVGIGVVVAGASVGMAVHFFAERARHRQEAIWAAEIAAMPCVPDQNPQIPCNPKLGLKFDSRAQGYYLKP